MPFHAITFHQGQVSLSSYALPDLQDGELMIKTEYSCVSPGTELRCLSGNQANAPMTAYVPGYALVGSVVCGRSATIRKGDRVFCAGTTYAGVLATCWGGHCEMAIANADSCIKVPDGLDSICASLAAMGAIAHHGLTKSCPQPGENTVVIGLGVLGQLSARLHAHAGAKVVACDLSARRVKQCEQTGIRAVKTGEDMTLAVSALMPAGATLVVDCTGAPAVIRQAIALVREIPWNDEPEPNNRYLVQGSYPNDISIPYHGHDNNDAFSKQLKFIFPRNRQQQDVEAFLRMLAAGEVQTDDLVSEVCSPVEAPQAYTELMNLDKSAGTIIFDWNVLE